MADVSAELQVEIEQFLHREARLLDESRFREWLALFTDDVVYRMPVRRAVGPGPQGAAEIQSVFCLFDDDKTSLEMRTMRLETGLAHSEIPQSVTQRLTTNVMVSQAHQGSELEVFSSFLVYQERLGRHGTTFIGRRNDRLRASDAGWKIARRDIELAQTILPSTISIFF